MFERFTAQLRQSLVEAKGEAASLGHNFIGTEHLLLGLLRLEEGIACEVLDDIGVRYAEARTVVARTIGSGMDGGALAAIGIDLDAVRRTAEESFGPGSLDRALAGQPPSTLLGPRVTPRAKKALELAVRDAKGQRHNYIGTEHLLLGIVREGHGVAAHVLREIAPQADIRQLIVDRIRAAS